MIFFSDYTVNQKETEKSIYYGITQKINGLINIHPNAKHSSNNLLIIS